jgi:uncharacterized protein (DUF433 family)
VRRERHDARAHGVRAREGTVQLRLQARALRVVWRHGPKVTSVKHPHVDTSGPDALIEGTRVPVKRLWDAHRRGTPIATLFVRYPGLPRGHILSALSFAYDTFDEVK